MAYDKIIVTGCSLSTGYEINDHLLGTFNNYRERQVEILRWYKGKFSPSSASVKTFYDTAFDKWHNEERKNSWPALLEKQTGISVENLAITGSSIGRSLLTYSKYLKENAISNALAIHQVPVFGRITLNFNKEVGKIDVLPKDIATGHGFDYDKKFYKKEITAIRKKFKNAVSKEGFLEKHYKKIIEKLHYLSMKNNIDNFYILDNSYIVPNLIKDNILMNNLQEFLKQFNKGKFGHPIDKKYNENMCNIVRTIL